MSALDADLLDLTLDAAEPEVTLQTTHAEHVVVQVHKRRQVTTMCVDLTRADASTVADVTRTLLGVSLLVPDVLMLLVTFAQLSTASRLACVDRTCREVVAVLVGKRLAILSYWARIIWVEKTIMAMETTVAATAKMPPLPETLHTDFINALGMVANARNRCPNRVGVFCYSQQRKIALKIFFKCPRRHGWLQTVRGVPAAYAMRHSTDDLTLSCSSCGRYQIEEDPKLFHCPRFGCCYDLCLVCAASLAQNRKLEIDSITGCREQMEEMPSVAREIITISD